MRTLLQAIFLALAIGLALLSADAAIQEEPVGLDRATAAEAADETSEGEEAEHAEEAEGPLAVLFRWINFAILFGGLGYLLRQPARDFFEQRQAEIRGGLEKSRQAQADATSRMSEIDGRLAKLTDEIAQIASVADDSARKERARIIADAKVEASRALGQSEAEVERLARGMEREIREQVADRVVEQAEEILRAKLTDQDSGRLIQRAVEKL
jgi:F-type H+-transporting ATPase subunit b